MSAQAALAAAIARLRAAGVADPARDARLLLAHALQIGPDRLTLDMPQTLDPEPFGRFEAALAERCARRPVSQIIGGRLFWGRWFSVTPDVLDPRPETEMLIDAALQAPFDRVLDLGTGSGAILLTLLAERPGARGLGVDISARALAVAQANSHALGLADRAGWQLSDWFGAVSGTFDLVVSNPPYIAAAEMAELAPETRLWEPELALSPGGDGLGAYRAIAAGLAQVLSPGGRVVLEIGPTQAGAVSELLATAGLVEISLVRDFDQRDRVVMARRPMQG